jgi:hypothetical protein
MTGEWFRLVDGQQQGPFTRDELLAGLRERSRGVLIWHQGMPGWARPEQVDELRPPPLPAPPPEETRASFAAAFHALAAAFGAEARGADDEVSFDAIVDGTTVQVSCELDDGSVELSLSVKDVPLPELNAYFEGELERIGKRVRANREALSGDADFDGRVYLDSPLPEPGVREIAGRPAYRRGVLDLLERGFAWVRSDADGLEAARLAERADELARPRVEPALVSLARVAATLRDADPGWLQHRSSSWPWWLMAGAGLAAPVAGVGFLFAWGMWEPSQEGLTWLALAGGVAAWALAMVPLFLLLRGRSSAMLHLTITGLLLLAAVPCATAGSLFAYNALFDTGPAAEREMTVASKDSVRSRRVRVSRFTPRYRKHHYVTLVAGSVTRTVGVSREAFDQLEDGAPVTVSYQRGALGWEWDTRLLR